MGKNGGFILMRVSEGVSVTLGSFWITTNCPLVPGNA